jgi:hypothetical protein
MHARSTSSSQLRDRKHCKRREKEEDKNAFLLDFFFLAVPSLSSQQQGVENSLCLCVARLRRTVYLSSNVDTFFARSSSLVREENESSTYTPQPALSLLTS